MYPGGMDMWQWSCLLGSQVRETRGSKDSSALTDFAQPEVGVYTQL